MTLKKLEDIASTAREVAHALVAILGSAAASAGLIVTLLESVGVHVTAAQVAQQAGAAGMAAVLISKAIDSANNAITTRGASLITAPGAPNGGTTS